MEIGTSFGFFDIISNKNHRVFFKQNYVPPKPPDFNKVQAEKAIKYTYDPKTGIWGKSTIQIKVYWTKFKFRLISKNQIPLFRLKVSPLRAEDFEQLIT
jgi:hypothetical protein